MVCQRGFTLTLVSFEAAIDFDMMPCGRILPTLMTLSSSSYDDNSPPCTQGAPRSSSCLAGNE